MTQQSVEAEVAVAGEDATVGAAPARRRFAAYTRDPKFVIGISVVVFFALVALVGPFLVGDPVRQTGPNLEGPSGEHWLGTTAIGQDVLAQVVVGSRSSLLVGVIAGSVSVVLATVVGMVSGYAGGWLDEVLNMFSNIFLVIPGLPLVIVLASYLQGGGGAGGLWAIGVVIAVTSWAASARVLRAQTLSLSRRDYVDAARASGERTWRILFVEILPNLSPILVSQFIWAVLGAILAEAGLSFLGLGDLNSVTWGTTLFFAQNGEALARDAWWWFAPPGICIALLGAGLTLINLSVDEVINPRLRVFKRRQSGKGTR